MRRAVGALCSAAMVPPAEGMEIIRPGSMRMAFERAPQAYLTYTDREPRQWVIQNPWTYDICLT